MDVSKLSFASLKDKVSSKLKGDIPQKTRAKKDNEGSKGMNSRNQKPEKTKKQKSPKQSTSAKPVPVPAKSGTDQEETEEDILRREALELGATEEDLKLLEGISEGEESEQEFESSSAKLDKSFGDDLGAFMKSIGLGSGEAVVIDDNVAEEQEEEEEEEEVEEEEEEEEEEEVGYEEEQDDVDEEEEEDIRETQLNFKEPKQASKSDKLESVSSVITDRLVVDARTDWYNIKLSCPPAEKLSPQQVARLIEIGKEVLEQDNKVYYEEFSKSSSQRKFLSEILTSGTLNDKISALTLLIQEAPLHNLKAFDNLLGMCSKKSRTAALQSINALKDLFMNGLLPDRKLVAFTKQSVLSNAMGKKELAILYFEDYLKKAYFKFIGILELLSHDPIVHVRMNVLNHLFDLLKAKPEQEANLLRLGVNKLGDIENKVSAKTSYQILQLEQQHPAMKKIVIDAVTDVIFKKNNEYHATYYAVLALNQTILTRKEDDIANSLIKTYFTLFEKVLIETDGKSTTELKDTEYNKGRTKRNFKKGKKGGKSVKETKSENEVIEEKNSKLFSSILTGLNRAFPFCSLSHEIFTQHLDTLFKITHSTNFNTSVQALVLIHHIVSSQKLNTDRFYRTLYESLLDQRLVSSSKQGIYLNLLFKSLKQDTDSNRISSFVKRICQICLNWLNIGTISGMIYLLINLEKSIPSLRNLILTTPTDSALGDNGNVDANELEKVENYDPKQRDPRFTHAETSSLWELNQFLNHYHPTVSLYAESLLEAKADVNKPDLGLYTLAHFLDKFVYKNAKQNPTLKGSSIMQPLAGAQTGSLLVKTSGIAGDESVPVNTRDWLHTKTSEVRPDELFFYKYFSSKQDKISRSKFDKELNKKAADDEESGSDLDDGDVWSALVKSNPEVEGGDESDFDDFDDELSDFDENDFSDIDSDASDEDDLKNIDLENSTDSEGEEDEEQEVQTQSIGSASDLEAEEEVDSDVSDSVEAEIFKGDSEDEYDSEEIELEPFDDSDSETESAKTSKKRKSSEPTDNKSKKSRRKELPVFADADEYAKYLDSEDDEF